MPIFDQSYQTYDGTYNKNPLTRWIPITINGLLSFLKTRRMLVFMILAFLFAVYPAGKIILAYFMPFLGYSYLKIDNKIFIDFFVYQYFWVGLFCLFIGVKLISIDLRTSAHIFYFCRPLTIKDYIFSKFMIIFSLLSAITIVPALLVICIKIFFTDTAYDPKNWEYFFGCVLAWLSVCVPASLISLAASCMSKNLNICGFLFLTPYLFSNFISAILSRVFFRHEEFSISDLINYRELIHDLVDSSFTHTLDKPFYYSVIVIGSLCVISIFTVYIKLKRSGINS